MPRLGDSNNTETHQIIGSNFSYSGTRLAKLGATEFTVYGIVWDATPSTDYFLEDLRQAVIAAVGACAKSPRAGNLLVRVTQFNDAIGVREVHGFIANSTIAPKSGLDLSKGIDPAVLYPVPTTAGWTNLYDATYEGAEVVVSYAEQLMNNDFLANGIIFIVTDGADNRSRVTPAMIKQLIEGAERTGEANSRNIESLLVILIGINTSECGSYLKAFKEEAGIHRYIDVKDATSKSLARLADFISESVSSQSEALGTGGPSQNIAATI